MASVKNDINDIIKKCKILLLDIEGTTTSISFDKDKLFPYAEANVKEFLGAQWDNETVKEVIAGLRKLALEDEEKKTEGVVTIPGEDAGKEEQIEGLVKNVQWQMSLDRKVGPLKQLQGLIWKQGYEKGDIKGHVYDDVLPALQQWLATEGQKVYIYSSGSVQAQKLLFGQSVAGDLMPMIEGYFDTAVGAKQEAASYVNIVEKIGCKAEEILFLSDIVKEVEAARASGLNTALVTREGNAALPAEAAASFPVINSFTQLTVSNKRKPEPQEQELPAKVPKTDIEGDVKTASETEVKEQPEAPVSTEAETVAKDKEEAEKMEVEETSPVENSTAAEKVEPVPEKSEEPVRTETVVEEITNSNDAADTPVSDVVPIVEESVEKTEKIETEQMDTESSEAVGKDETVMEPKEPVKETSETATVAEETPPNVITVQDVTDEPAINDAAEIIDDLVPVVEEPMTVEMQELQNVGDVLEKECDEILSKVQDVTNLDSLPVKPMLNSIAEESIDAENGENTNDIVESILATEMELGVNTEQEIVCKKPEEAEETNEVAKESSEKSDEKPVEHATEPVVEKVDSAAEAKAIAENVTEDVSTTMVTEEDKNGESTVSTESTNGDVKDTVEDKMEVSSTEPETKIVSKTNGSTEDSVEKPETKDNEAEPKDKEEIKPVDSTPKSVEPESTVEADTEMKSKESVDNKKEEEAESSSVTHTKMETENKIESEVTSKQEATKIETNGTKVDDNGMESESAKSDVPEIKVTASDEKTEPAPEMENGEKKLNGNAKEANTNGVGKDDELSARLSENGENGKEMNGANGNGDSAMEIGQGDSKIEKEIPDIKVKTVTSDEPRTDPIEQPTEA